MNEHSPQSPLELKAGPEKGSDSRTDGSKEDSAAKARAFEKEPWFAKLPPALQQAIQAKSRQRAPRGYEERLRRYFENVDE